MFDALFILGMTISIPQWSDFNQVLSDIWLLTCIISIPQWSDFNNLTPAVDLVINTVFQSHNGLILIQYNKL